MKGALIESSTGSEMQVLKGGSRKKAVIYLRVSTPSQVNTDDNPEGISLPAQRERCQPKCAELGADVVREFVEPGRTASSIEKRPVFQEMLAWIKEQGHIDSIVVYHFNRIFRNSIDRAITKRDLARIGTRIVSTVVDLGEGPESEMVDTILSAVDEHQSTANGADSTQPSDSERHAIVEQICDYFAGCSLMPSPWIKRTYCSGVQYVPDLAKAFGVSRAAMTVRLSPTGLTDPTPRWLRTAGDWAEADRLDVASLTGRG